MLRVDRIPAAARVSVGLGAVIVAAVLLSACSEATHEPLTVEVAKITIEADQFSIREGGTTQLVASVQSRYGYELERQVTWSSGSPELATVDANGLVTGVQGGYPEITAMAEGLRASILITVEEYPKTLEVAQVGAMEIGDKVRPVATVLCGRGHAMDVPLTWTTANPQVAQVDATGQILAVGPGETTITAEGAGFSETVSISVKEPAAWLMLEAASTFMLIGQEAKLTAIPRGAAMNIVNRTITWTSSAPGVVSVTGDGSIKALAAGPATIMAYSDGAVGFVGIIVEEPVGLVWVTRNQAPVRPNSTVQFTVQTRTAEGALLLGRAVDWSTSNPAIATIDPNGKLITHAPGTVEVYAESEGVVSTASVTVENWIDTLEMNPSVLTLGQGMMGQFMVTARDAAGNILHPQFTWTSSDPEVLVMGKTGGVSAYEPGEAVVTASAEGESVSVNVTVIPAVQPVLCDHLVLDKDYLQLGVEAVGELWATTYDADGNVITPPSPLLWESSDEMVATVDAPSTYKEWASVMAQGFGTATITVTCGSATAEALVEVKKPTKEWHDVTYAMLHGTFRVWNPAIQSVSAGSFSGNVAAVPPGATVTMTGNWQKGRVTWIGSCPFCVIQMYVAWIPEAHGVAPWNQCLWQGMSPVLEPELGPKGTFTWTTKVPHEPGLYYVGAGQSLQYSCQSGTKGYFGYPTGGPTSQAAASFLIVVK